MSKTQARAARWTLIRTADLAAAVGELPEPGEELLAAAQAGGFEDPIFVVTASSGLRVVDGKRRIAAAHAAGIEELPTTDRPVIRLALLTAHPGNVRGDLDLTKELLASIEEEGIVTALALTRDPGVDGGIRVIDGHRRLAAGLKVKETHAPYQWEGDRSEASQYLDMVTTATHRKGLTRAEASAALFAAVNAGAKVGRAAKAAGITVKQARQAVKAGGSSAVARVAKAVEMDFDTMEDLAALEEAAPELAASVEKQIQGNPRAARYYVREAHETLARRRAAEAHRAELETAGAAFRDHAELSEKARRTAGLPVDADEHATGCRGAVWVLEDEDAESYTQWCSNVVLYEHVTELEAKTTKPETDPAQKAANKNVRAGNVHWETTEGVRREWVTEFLAKGRHTKEDLATMQEVTTRHLLTASEVMAHYNKPKTCTLLGPLLGKGEHYNRSSLSADVAKASGPRRTVLAFAVIAAAYESYMDRAAWRTDGATGSDIYRPKAAEWLTLLTGFGYPASPIEEATRDGRAYNALDQQRAEADADQQAPTLDDDQDQAAEDGAADQ